MKKRMIVKDDVQIREIMDALAIAIDALVSSDEEKRRGVVATLTNTYRVLESDFKRGK
jgi:hypothetical protein